MKENMGGFQLVDFIMIEFKNQKRCLAKVHLIPSCLFYRQKFNVHLVHDALLK